MEAEELRRLEAIAHAAGDTEKADLLSTIADLIEERSDFEDIEEELKTLKRETEDHNAYKEFFFSCFDFLSGHYPCPSVTSDYDQGVIFSAIQKGEEAAE